jgi:hypothetical protein
MLQVLPRVSVVPEESDEAEEHRRPTKDYPPVDRRLHEDFQSSHGDDDPAEFGQFGGSHKSRQLFLNSDGSPRSGLLGPVNIKPSAATNQVS